MTFQIACSPNMLWEKADFVLLMKAQVTRKRVYLHKPFFTNYVIAGFGNSLKYSICSYIYSEPKNLKLLLVISISKACCRST